MQPNTNPTTMSAPTHKHAVLWSIAFIMLLAVALFLWNWTSRNPVGGNLMNQYNAELNQPMQETSQVLTDQDSQAIENDINASLSTDIESDLKSIDLEF